MQHSDFLCGELVTAAAGSLPVFLQHAASKLQLVLVSIISHTPHLTSRHISLLCAECPFAHEGEKATRRCPALYLYSSIVCPDVRQVCLCVLGPAAPAAVAALHTSALVTSARPLKWYTIIPTPALLVLHSHGHSTARKSFDTCLSGHCACLCVPLAVEALSKRGRMPLLTQHI